MKSGAIDSRKVPRYTTGLGVLITSGAQTLEGRIIQVSRGGCFVLPILPFSQSSKLRVSFRLADDAPPINCIGEVVYSISDKGSGVVFTEISIYNQDLITQHFDNSPAVGPSKSVRAGAG